MSRTPIPINHNTIALITLYHKTSFLEDLWSMDMDLWLEAKAPLHKEAAKQFVAHLDEHWTPAFMMALRDEITEELKAHDAQYGTNFANEPAPE